MDSSVYHFVTHWRVRGAVEEVFDILSDPLDLVRWWPSVYLDVQEIAPGDENNIGRVIDLYTKGWLPYSLRWQFTVTEVERPTHIALKASGDFDGEGVWTLAQDGEFVNVEYDWRISAEKPLLKYLSFVMKPIFSANHHWAMDKGLESLKIELMRRQAQTAEELAQVPKPPGATFTF